MRNIHPHLVCPRPRVVPFLRVHGFTQVMSACHNCWHETANRHRKYFHSANKSAQATCCMRLFFTLTEDNCHHGQQTTRPSIRQWPFLQIPAVNGFRAVACAQVVTAFPARIACCLPSSVYPSLCSAVTSLLSCEFVLIHLAQDCNTLHSHLPLSSKVDAFMRSGCSMHMCICKGIIPGPKLSVPNDATSKI